MRIDNGVVGSLIGGTRRKSSGGGRVSKVLNTVTDVSNALNVAQQPEIETKNEKPSLPMDEQVEALKKLKELLDAEILTQEEFDQKKKEILNL